VFVSRWGDAPFSCKKEDKWIHFIDMHSGKIDERLHRRETQLPDLLKSFRTGVAFAIATILLSLLVAS
jgi:hypothetical protein